MFHRGLIIGKFLPVHKGHMALIEFASSQCEEMIVSMSFTENDPIDPMLRFSWLQDLCKDNDRIAPAMIKDDFDDESLPLEERTAIWAAKIRATYPQVDAVFSSEDYGDPFAAHLHAIHIKFDQARTVIPVSASQIRKHPYRYWDFIPEIVRPYFVKKICFYGPESTGKSTIAQRMAEVYNTDYVPEVAREMITSNTFTIDDIMRIGNAQTERVKEKIKTANKILFCDTDVITTQLYSRHYLGTVPDVLYDLEKEIRYDQYFLFDIDVPWIADGLRDLGHKRQEMFDLFRKELEKRNINYLTVSGDYSDREAFIQSYVTARLDL